MALLRLLPPAALQVSRGRNRLQRLLQIDLDAARIAADQVTDNLGRTRREVIDMPVGGTLHIAERADLVADAAELGDITEFLAGDIRPPPDDEHASRVTHCGIKKVEPG